MTPKEFAKLLARDIHCLHCGAEDETLVVQHRKNRGMGGAGKLSDRNKPSNLVVICSWFNTAMESDPDEQQRARSMGIKLDSWQSCLEEPVYDAVWNKWFLLDDDWGNVELLDWGNEG